MANENKIDQAINLVSLWAARVALAVLAVAGMLHLLGGVDPIIVYPITAVSVALLLKETL